MDRGLPPIARNDYFQNHILNGTLDGKNTDTENINIDLDIVKSAYQNKKADGQLTVVHLKPTEKPYDLYIEWVK